MSFARSVSQHDAASFAEHVHPHALFVGFDGGLVDGRDAIVKDWASLLRGDDAAIAWYPTSVSAIGDGRIALSRGPFWLESKRPDAKARFLEGTFQSVWTLGDDGTWRVTLDGGTAPPVPADQAKIAELVRAAPSKCPY